MPLDLMVCLRNPIFDTQHDIYFPAIKNLIFNMLKNKLEKRKTYALKILSVFRQTSVPIKSTGRSWGQGFYRKDPEAEQGKYLIGYSLISCII